MLFGAATFGLYIYLMSNLDSITLSESKNYMIALPLLLIFSFLEIFAELKYGFIKSGQLAKKGVKNTWSYFKFKRLSKKIKNNKELKPKQINWLKKYKEKRGL